MTKTTKCQDCNMEIIYTGADVFLDLPNEINTRSGVIPAWVECTACGGKAPAEEIAEGVPRPKSGHQG